MQFIKGFRKNYFSLAAITIYSSAKKISDIFFQIKTLRRVELYSSEDSDDPPPIDDQSFCTCAISTKPCHCNQIFATKAHLAVRLHIFIPRGPYYNKYFAFRRTGTHPPL